MSSQGQLYRRPTQAGINEGCRRLLWIGKGRKKTILVAFFKWFGRGPTSGLLKSPENLKKEPRLSLKDLLKIDLKTVRTYLLTATRGAALRASS